MNEIIHAGFTYRECTVFPGKPHDFKRWIQKKEPKKGNEKKGRRKTKSTVSQTKSVFKKPGVVTVPKSCNLRTEICPSNLTGIISNLDESHSNGRVGTKVVFQRYKN